MMLAYAKPKLLTLFVAMQIAASDFGLVTDRETLVLEQALKDLSSVLDLLNKKSLAQQDFVALLQDVGFKGDSAAVFSDLCRQCAEVAGSPTPPTAITVHDLRLLHYSGRPHRRAVLGKVADALRTLFRADETLSWSACDRADLRDFVAPPGWSRRR